MSTVAETPPQAHPGRQKALEQFINKLRAWNGSSTSDQQLERAARITVGTRTVTLEPWDRQQLSAWFAAEESAVPAPRYLLAHGAALMLKSAFDIERLTLANDGSSANMYALQAELMLDTAVGMALLQDIQRATDELVKAGEFEEAKGLTQFRHRLAHVVSDAKMCMAESEQEQAESIASTLTDQPGSAPAAAPGRHSLMAPVARASAPVPAGPPRPAVPEAVEVATSDVAAPTPAQDLSQVIAPDGSAVSTRKRRPRAKRPNSARSAPAAGLTSSSGAGLDAGANSGPSLTFVLVVACLVMGAAWFAATQLPALLARAPSVMTRGDFAADLPITSVESHVPSVFVTIDTADWAALDAAAREDMIKELGRSAAPEGFSGLLLRSDLGVPLAHWLASRGASEIVDGEDGPANLRQEPPPVVEFKAVGRDN